MNMDHINKFRTDKDHKMRHGYANRDHKMPTREDEQVKHFAQDEEDRQLSLKQKEARSNDRMPEVSEYPDDREPLKTRSV